MTTNQIAYQTLLEQRRANQAREAENYRSNTASEEIKRNELAEEQRHNTASEILSGDTLKEQKRHNVVSEIETGFKYITDSFNNTLRTISSVAGGLITAGG